MTPSTGDDVSDVPRDTSQTSVSDLDLTTWLTKQQAADLLQVSTKAVERFAQAGKLEQRTRRQAHGPHVVVYYPDDVARLAQERQGGPPPPFVVRTPAAPPAGNGNVHSESADSTLARVAGEDSVRTIVAAVAAALMSQTALSQTSQTWMSQTLWLSIEQAAAYTGLTAAYLRRQIASGQLAAVKDRGWRIRRRDLEAL